jgi:hypothetical protein
MEEERAQIVRENAYLRDQIARAASASTLLERAFSFGYVTTGTVHFVSLAPVMMPEADLEQPPP